MIQNLKIADYITLLNLVSGLLAIYFAFNNNLVLSATFILLGVIIDKLDGIIARALKQESKLGVQLDSFADIITFGVAPAALVVNNFGILWVSMLSLLLPIAGTLRLARFNITKTLFSKHFTGVPITMNGIIFPVLFFAGANGIVFGVIIVLMSFLMVSDIKIKKVI